MRTLEPISGRNPRPTAGATEISKGPVRARQNMFGSASVVQRPTRFAEFVETWYEIHSNQAVARGKFSSASAHNAEGFKCRTPHW